MNPNEIRFLAILMCAAIGAFPLLLNYLDPKTPRNIKIVGYVWAAVWCMPAIYGLFRAALS